MDIFAAHGVRPPLRFNQKNGQRQQVSLQRKMAFASTKSLLHSAYTFVFRIRMQARVLLHRHRLSCFSSLPLIIPSSSLRLPPPCAHRLHHSPIMFRFLPLLLRLPEHLHMPCSKCVFGLVQRPVGLVSWPYKHGHMCSAWGPSRAKKTQPPYICALHSNPPPPLPPISMMFG